MQHTSPLTMPVHPPELGGGLAFHPREGSGSCLGQMHASEGNDRGELRPGQAAELAQGTAGTGCHLSPLAVAHSPCPSPPWMGSARFSWPSQPGM